jgi:glycosyltransferase involved in cell wall biosynthesis
MTNIGASGGTSDAGGASGRASADGLSVAAVVNTFPAPSQTFIRRKLDGLHRAGVDVTVVATELGPGAEHAGFHLVSAAPWRHPRQLRSARGRQDWRALAATVPPGDLVSPQRLRRDLVAAPLRALHTDVVHFEFSGIAVSYLDALEDLHSRHRLVVSCRGAAEQIEPLKDPRRAVALREVFSVVDLIHCVSDDMRRTVEALGAPSDRILVNRPAVPVDAFRGLRPAPEHDGPLQVLSIGRLHWKKGHDDGLRAIAALRDRGVEVQHRIAGEGDQREKLLFLVDQLGLGDSVELLGTCTEEQVRAELARADVLLLPSLSEGISNAVLEAMASGRPVVSTDCGGMSEVIDDGVDAMLVGIGDVDAMADRLEALARDPELRRRMGAAAATTADRDLDVSRQVRVFLDAYRALTAP